jgi:glycolate oxidase iron-sulfur subunit
MRSVAEGRLENTSSAFSNHIDRCLGCRACEQVCPAGVEYGTLLEASRAELLQAQPKNDFSNRLLRLVLRHLWLSPTRLRMFFGASRLFRDLGLAKLLLKSGLVKLISPRAQFGLTLLESSRGSNDSAVRRAAPECRPYKNAKTDQQPESVSLFSGCVGEGLFARVNRATARVLRANGFLVETPAEQVCCGALHAHAGDLEGAKKLARQNIKAFNQGGPIITNAGGCGAMLVSYGHLFANHDELVSAATEFSARVRDVSQQLQTCSIRIGDEVRDERMTYDASCHLMYGQKAGESSLKMLQSIPGLNFINLEGSERCCGGAGIYNLLHPELSSQVLDEKISNIRNTDAEVLATGNPGCQMQIGAGACQAGLNLRVCHPIELVDESYAKAGFYSEVQR